MAEQGKADDNRFKITQGKTRPDVKGAAHEFLDSTAHLGSYVGSANTGNVIVKFAEPKIGSLRISDQACDPTYCTRWNLMLDKFVKVESKYKSHWYADADMFHLIEHLNRYAETIARNNPPADVAQSDGEKNQDANYWAHQLKMREEG